MYQAFINLPRTFKFIFGLFSDNVAIYGLRRKPYVIIFSITLFLSMVSIYAFQLEDAKYVAILLTISNGSLACISVVTEAMMVAESRKDT